MSTENAIVPVSEPAAAAVELVDMFGSAARRQWCSFEVETDEQRWRLYEAQVSESEGLEEVCNTIIEFKDFLIETWDHVRQGGEVENRWRMVLMLTDGRIIGTSSRGAQRSMRVLVKTFGLPHQWRAPMRCKVTSVVLPPDPATGVARRTFDLVAQRPIQKEGKKTK